jgi:hypothetical protein
MEVRKSSTYESSANWYIGSTIPRSLRTKYRMDARKAAGRYVSATYLAFSRAKRRESGIRRDV